MKAWKKGAGNKFLNLYLLATLTFITLALINLMYGKIRIKAAFILIFFMVWYTYEILKTSRWDTLESNPKFKKFYRVGASGLFMLLILEIQRLIGLSDYLLSFGFYGVVVHLLEIIILMEGFYYFISEKFLSKALENGGLLWKGDKK